MVSEDIKQQVIGYVRSYSASHSLPEVIDRVRGTLDDLEALVSSMTPEQAAFSPAPDDWTSQEVAGHIAQYSPAVTRLVTLLDAGEKGEYYRAPDMPPERPVSDVSVQDGVAVARRELDTIEGKFAGREPNLEATFPHPWFGELNAREWVLFSRIHAIDHMGQIRANIADAGYPA